MVCGAERYGEKWVAGMVVGQEIFSLVCALLRCVDRSGRTLESARCAPIFFGASGTCVLKS